jgi:2-oxoglutarate dehydrogenase E1 component
MPLGEIMDKLKYTYCSQVGVEYMHMQDVARKDWVQKKVRFWEDSRHDLIPY